MSLFVQSMRSNSDVLLQLFNFNDRMRRRSQFELNQSKSDIESKSNLILELEQNKQLYMMRYEVLEEQFNLLFNSIETISNAKNLEDKYAQQIELLNNQL